MQAQRDHQPTITNIHRGQAHHHCSTVYHKDCSNSRGHRLWRVQTGHNHLGQIAVVGHLPVRGQFPSLAIRLQDRSMLPLHPRRPIQTLAHSHPLPWNRVCTHLHRRMGITPTRRSARGENHSPWDLPVRLPCSLPSLHLPYFLPAGWLICSCAPAITYYHPTHIPFADSYHASFSCLLHL